MTASVLIAAFLTTGLVVCVVLVAVTFRQALDRTLDALVEARESHAIQMQHLLDRFQAIKWEDLAAMRAIEEPEQEGGFFPPATLESAEQDGGQETPGRWGTVSAIRARQQEIEDTLVAEDFPDEDRRG